MDDWHPNPGQQTKALQRPEYEVLYGGARGGGKTDAGIMWMLKCIDNPRFRGLVIRKNSNDLVDWVDRAAYWYQAYGARPAGNPPVFKFPSGAKIRTGHLKDESAYEKYQGHEYQRMLIEELTQIPREKDYQMLLASCRSTVEGISARIFLTTNPGGVGHGWVKARFISAAPWERRFLGNDTKRSRIFIPAKIEDNPKLMEKDPLYVNTIDAYKSTDIELWKAWRLGDWDTFAGQFFREFRHDIHVLNRSFVPKEGLFVIGGMDWGSAKPFAYLASVVLPREHITADGDRVRFHRVITFQEVYGTEKRPNEWSQIMKRRVPPKTSKWIMADNMIFAPNNDLSMSIFEQFCQDELLWREKILPATKDRVGGWTNMHNWLSMAPDGLPYWMMTPNCVNLIRTLPELVHDEDKVEDINTDGEDHAPDAARYMFSGLKWLDGKIGAVRGAGAPTPQNQIKVRKSERPIDLDEFAKAKFEGARDWRAVG